MATYGGDLSLQRFLALEARADPVRRRPRDRQRRLRPPRRAGDGADAGPLPPSASSGGDGRPSATSRCCAALALPRDPVPALRSGRQASGSAPPTGSNRRRTPTAASAPRPATAPSAAITGWAMLGLEAAGRNPLDVSRRGNTPVDFLRSHIDEDRAAAATSPARSSPSRAPASTRAPSPAEPGRRAGQAPRASNGSFEGWPGTTAYSVIALRDGGRDRGAGTDSLSWLRGVQNGDGGWGDEPGSPSNADVTGCGDAGDRRSTKAAERGLSYLRKAPALRAAASPSAARARSTRSRPAWAVQGMIAVGVDPPRVAPGRRQRPRLPDRAAGERRPFPLLGLQRPDPDLGHRRGPGGGGRKGAARSLPRRVRSQARRPGPRRPVAPARVRRRARRRPPNRRRKRVPAPPAAALHPVAPRLCPRRAAVRSRRRARRASGRRKGRPGRRRRGIGACSRRSLLRRPAPHRRPGCPWASAWPRPRWPSALPWWLGRRYGW